MFILKSQLLARRSAQVLGTSYISLVQKMLNKNKRVKPGGAGEEDQPDIDVNILS